MPEDSERGLTAEGGWALGLSTCGFLMRGSRLRPRPSASSGGRPAGLRAFRLALPRPGPVASPRPPRPPPEREVLAPVETGQLSGASDEGAGAVSVALGLHLSLRASGMLSGQGLGTATVSLPRPSALAGPGQSQAWTERSAGSMRRSPFGDVVVHILFSFDSRVSSR